MKPLNPVTAAIGAALFGTISLWTPASGQVFVQSKTIEKPVDVHPAGKPVETGVNNPVNELAKRVKDDVDARKAAGERIAKFLLEADKDGKSFVAADVNKEPLGAMVKDWVFKEDAGRVALLDFVIGLKEGQEELRVKLQNWAEHPITDIGGGVRGVSAFLNEAVAQAAKVLSESRSKSEKDGSIAQNDQGPGGGGKRLRTPAPPFDLKDLYYKGAVVGEKIYSKDDTDYQTISIKMYTSRKDKGELVNSIGIFDITDPKNITDYKYFPMSTSGEQTVALGGGPNSKKYTLSVKTNEKGRSEIFFGREGSKPGDEGTIRTTLEDLLLLRADQAAGDAASGVVTVGGEDFYVVPQGGEKGALALMSKDVVDRRSNLNDAEVRRLLRPSLFAETTKRDDDGESVPIPPGTNGGPKLGKVGGKEYHLEFNAKMGDWEIKEGPGDEPATPAPPPAPPAASSRRANAQQGGSDSSSEAVVDGGKLTEEMVAKIKGALSKPGCRAPDVGQIDDLDEDLKTQYALVNCWDEARQQARLEVIPAKGNGVVYDSTKLRRGYFREHYLVLESATSIQFLDLLQREKDSDGNDKIGFLPSGAMDLEKKTATGLLDAELAAVMLIQYMGLPDKGGLQILERVEKFAGDKTYVIDAMSKGGGLFVKLYVKEDKKAYEIFPNAEEITENSSKVEPNLYVGVNGPTNAFGGTPSSVDEDFQAQMEIEGHKTVGTLQKDIALYRSQDAPKKYYLMFKFPAKDGAGTAVFRTKAIEVFSDAPKGRPLPAGYGMAGLVASNAVIADRLAMGWSFVTGSSASRGALAVYQNKQISGEFLKNRGKNCAGAIFWWGVTPEAAQKACKEDKFDD